MIQISGNSIMRGGVKVGWLDGNDIRGAEGEKLGYFTGNDIYDESGRKLGYIEGDYLKTYDGRKVRIDEYRKHIFGGTISDLARAAISLLIGD